MEKELQDRAWRSLPEDFREEVKKEWQSANNKERLIHDAFLRGEHAMLVSIFGRNNLNREEKPAEPKFKYSIGQKVLLKFYGMEKSTITEAFTDGGVWPKYKVKMLPYHVWNENELEAYIDPDASHKQPDGENHPGETSHGNRNLSQDSANCEISRLQIAAMAMKGLIADWIKTPRCTITNEEMYKGLAETSIRFADALIAEAEKGGNHAD